jgi:adenylate cyclase
MRLPALLRQRVSLNTIFRVAAGLFLVVVFAGHESEIHPVRALEQVELQSYDARLRLFMPNRSDPRIVILDIDEKSLIKEGQMPWGRDKMALMVRQLFDRYRVKVVGFDVTFPEPDRGSALQTLEGLAAGELRDDAGFRAFLERARPALDSDRVFGKEIGKHAVVLGYFMSPKPDRAAVIPPPVLNGDALPRGHFSAVEATGWSGNRPEIQENATASGHLAPALDVDGITRSVPMLMRLDGNYYEAMSLALARTYLGNVPIAVHPELTTRGSETIGWIGSIGIGNGTIPLDEAMRALVPFRGGPYTFRYISATDVIRGTLPADELVDKIVIVGTSAQGLLDIRLTPVGEDYPGVEVHANMVSGILDQTIKQKPLYATAASTTIVLFLGLALALILPRLGVLASTATAACVLAAIVTGNLLLFKSGYVLNLAAPMLLVLLLYFFNIVYGFFLEARHKRLITGLFGTYVPKELVAEMSKNPEDYSMEGESRIMTVLFSDVRDFTSISEGLTAESLKDMMNTYLTAMTEVIQDKRGTIDKYIGDAIMAFWGAPIGDDKHAGHGVEAALDMQRRIRELDPEFAKRGWPHLNIGVGLNCGEMNVGDMGSRFRRAYTVMGDAVNLASRLEGLTKEYGVGILVSESMVAAAEGFVYREIDTVVVKGRTEGVKIYEPVGRQGTVGESTLSDIERFHKALDLYRKQRWEEAEALLKALSYAAPDNKLYKLYLKRLSHFRENTPGPAWNGQWVFTTK